MQLLELALELIGLRLLLLDLSVRLCHVRSRRETPLLLALRGLGDRRELRTVPPQI